jgi:hypothetical protein
MLSKPEIHKHLEAIIGHKLSPDEVERIRFTQTVASSTIADNGTITLQYVILARPNLCYGSRLLDVSGVAFTGTDGKLSFRLTSFICHAGERFGETINVVATPLSTAPCFVTVSHALVNTPQPGSDVEIQASSWDAAGAPAPLVSFDWRCRVELLTVIL